MIHQHIFATPKPGMTPEAFQAYWLNVHAPTIASKIQQIKRYKIDLRIPFSLDPDPVWHGIAEIWLRNQAEQLESLQSPEFLDGARADEPNWAAFWATLALDCSTESVKGSRSVPDDAVKLVVLYRHARGLTRGAYRELHRHRIAEAAAAEPAVLAHDLAFAVDGLYTVGAPGFDAIGHYWFANVDAAEAFVAEGKAVLLLPRDGEVVDPEQRFMMLVREHWVIGPEARD